MIFKLPLGDRSILEGCPGLRRPLTGLQTRKRCTGCEAQSFNVLPSLNAEGGIAGSQGTCLWGVGAHSQVANVLCPPLARAPDSEGSGRRLAVAGGSGGGTFRTGLKRGSLLQSCAESWSLVTWQPWTGDVVLMSICMSPRVTFFVSYC